VVPTLHEPLLLIAGLCDKGMTVIFDKSSFQIFKTSDFSILGKEVGAGYRRGNLFYLPSEKEVRFPRSLPSDAVSSSSLTYPTPSQKFFDLSLLGYHNLLLHLGVWPLKALLQQNNIQPSILNEIEVQKCPVCIQSKMS
jgi:hypothetical protein